MNAVRSAFAAFDETLNLDPRERDRAQKRHNDVRAVLESSGLVMCTFVQGSFARKTMLKPLKDVDIVVLLHPDSGFGGPDGPARAMDVFRKLVAAEWPTAIFDAGEAPAGKALRVEFDDLPFTFDLVPGFESDGEWVLIGDRQERRWEPSNTRIEIRKVSERNVLTGGSFVHQVRMLKAFVRHQTGLDFVKGIAVESIAFTAIHEHLPHEEALTQALRHGAQALDGPLIEPAGDDDVSVKWEPEERELAIKAFTMGADRAAEAVRLQRAGDEAAAVDVWHTTLGDDFPAAPLQSVDNLMKSWASGSVTSSGRTSSTTAGAVAAAPGRAWRHQ